MSVPSLHAHTRDTLTCCHKGAYQISEGPTHYHVVSSSIPSYYEVTFLTASLFFLPLRQTLRKEALEEYLAGGLKESSIVYQVSDIDAIEMTA